MSSPPSGERPISRLKKKRFMDHKLDSLSFDFGNEAMATENNWTQTTSTDVDPKPTAIKLLHDLPSDVAIVYLYPLYGPRDLAALTQTCKAMRDLMLPLLYKRLDISARPAPPSAPTLRTRHFFAWQMRKQKAAIQGLLRDPDVARHVRDFKLTIGANYSFHSSRALYRSFEILEKVEHVDIHGSLFHGFSPDNRVLTLQNGLADNIFPNAKTIKLRGVILFWLVERILLGGHKLELTSVELTHLTPGTSQWPEENDNFLFRRHGQAYIVYFVRSRAPSLKRWAVNGADKEIGPYDEDVVDMSVEGIRDHFVKPEVQKRFKLWLRGVPASRKVKTV